MLNIYAWAGCSLEVKEAARNVGAQLETLVIPCTRNPMPTQGTGTLCLWGRKSWILINGRAVWELGADYYLRHLLWKFD